MSRPSRPQRRRRDLQGTLTDHIARKRAIERRLTLGDFGFGGILLRREQRKIGRLLARIRRLQDT